MPQENNRTDAMEERLAMENLKETSFHRFNLGFALMSVIPLLVFFYILITKLFSLNILIGSIGMLVGISLCVTIFGYILTHDLLSHMITHMLRLRKQDKSKSRFIAIVSHELMNPITAIMGNIENMSSGIHGELTEDQRKTLELCQSMAKRMNKLAGGLIEMHKIEAGMITMDRSRFNLLELVKGQEDEFELKLKKKNIKFFNRTRGGDFYLWADEDKIAQVIHNLLGNSVKYTPVEGAINLELSKEDDFLKVVIHNTGPRIPTDKLDNIFDKYIRLETSEEGAGLGLAITKDIVDMHKGRIWAENDINEGTRFVVALPCDLRKGSVRRKGN
ncbi:MAG: HAMP domain-containing sensor histidine kinase [Candidatus Tantalella remota]|nr:HAMP domain-containing sensor histidine kinase [Candidatus Tantalella remota]